MEEDIKILEELTGAKIKFILAPEDRGFTAIENLIKGYRELEEIKNSKLDEYLHNNLWIYKYLAENYIPKSKIKEKIEELEKLKNKLKEEKNEFWIPEINNTIYHIHELMEDK